MYNGTGLSSTRKADLEPTTEHGTNIHWWWNQPHPCSWDSFNISPHCTHLLPCRNTTWEQSYIYLCLILHRNHIHCITAYSNCSYKLFCFICQMIGNVYVKQKPFSFFTHMQTCPPSFTRLRWMRGEWVSKQIERKKESKEYYRIEIQTQRNWIHIQLHMFEYGNMRKPNKVLVKCLTCIKKNK